MGRISLALIAAACALVLPVAQACKPLIPAEQIREFITTAQPSNAIVFTGKVVSVKERRQADGGVITETMLLPTTWWMNFHSGAVVVRTTTSARSPCPDIGVLHAMVGEKWLISGWLHDTAGGSWAELGGGMRLKDGRLPSHLEQKLRRLKAAG